MQEHGPFLIRCRALLRECRAPLREYRALLMKSRAFLSFNMSYRRSFQRHAAAAPAAATPLSNVCMKLFQSEEGATKEGNDRDKKGESNRESERVSISRGRDDFFLLSFSFPPFFCCLFVLSLPFKFVKTC